MSYDWKKGDWRKKEGGCYFEAGKNNCLKVEVFNNDSGYGIVVTYNHCYTVFRELHAVGHGPEELISAKRRGEQIIQKIKNDING